MVSNATTDRQVAAAIGEGAVSEITVRATDADVGDGKMGVVAFLFRSPVRPGTVPWDVLCDVAGQTDEWRGVAALVGPADEVEGSPIWLTGANCVGWQELG